MAVKQAKTKSATVVEKKPKAAPAPAVEKAAEAPKAPQSVLLDEQFQQPSQQPHITVGQDYTYSRPNTPMPLSNFLSKFPTQSRLSTEGQAYIDTLIEMLRKIQTGLVVTAMPITSVDIDAMVIYDDVQKRGVCLLFSESFMNTNEPPTSRVPAIMDQFHALLKDKNKGIDGTIKLLTSIVVIPEEYSSNYANKMAYAITNLLIGHTHKQVFNAESLRGVELMVTTNQQLVRSYIAACDPHIASERNDIGFLVSTGRREGRTLVPDEHLFAVSGYTKFASPYELGAAGDIRGRIMPIPTITTIASKAPVAGYIPFALTVATDCFCVNGMWREPYKKFASDQGNLGKLVDTVGRPVTNQQELTQLIAQYFTPPVLAIDVTEGRYSIPGLTAFGNENYIDTFISIEEFFGIQMTEEYYQRLGLGDKSTEERKQGLQEYAKRQFNILCDYNTVNGVSNINSQLVDTRFVDFLLLSTTFDDLAAISNFKIQSRNPFDRLNAIRAHYPDTRMLYNTRTMVFGEMFAKYLIVDRFNHSPIILNNDYMDLSSNYIYSNSISNQPIDWSNQAYSLNQATQRTGQRQNPWY